MQWVRVGQLPVLAARSDAAWRRALEQVSHVLEQVRLRDHDCAWCLELAGDRAREAGYEERAAYCYTASAAHWRAVGEGERAASVEARLG